MKEFKEHQMTLGDTLFSANLGYMSFTNMIPPKMGKSKSLLTSEDLN